MVEPGAAVRRVTAMRILPRRWVRSHAPSVASDAPSVATDAASMATDAPSRASDVPSRASDAPSRVADAPSVASDAPSMASDAASVASEFASDASNAPSGASWGASPRRYPDVLRHADPEGAPPGAARLYPDVPAPASVRDARVRSRARGPVDHEVAAQRVVARHRVVRPDRRRELAHAAVGEGGVALRLPGVAEAQVPLVGETAHRRINVAVARAQRHRPVVPEGARGDQGEYVVGREVAVLRRGRAVP